MNGLSLRAASCCIGICRVSCTPPFSNKTFWNANYFSACFSSRPSAPLCQWFLIVFVDSFWEVYGNRKKGKCSFQRGMDNSYKTHPATVLKSCAGAAEHLQDGGGHIITTPLRAPPPTPCFITCLDTLLGFSSKSLLGWAFGGWGFRTMSLFLWFITGHFCSLNSCAETVASNYKAWSKIGGVWSSRFRHSVLAHFPLYFIL